MKEKENYRIRAECSNTKLWWFSCIILIIILITHGTYIRVRPYSDVPTIDWLIMLRLLSCCVGIILGILLLRKNTSFGISTKILLLFICSCGISAIFSKYPTVVLGYTILILGAGMLLIGMVYSSPNRIYLIKIEQIWFIITSLSVIKDALISMVLLNYLGGENRLGMSSLHPNQLSFLAGIVFWLSFRNRGGKYALIYWSLRIFMLFIIIKAQSRASLLAFIVGGVCFLTLKYISDYRKTIIILCLIGVLFSSLGILYAFNNRWSDPVMNYLKRGQDIREILSFTGRTELWKDAMKEAIEKPVFGHGYGISRLFEIELGDYQQQAAHLHNEFLEVFFGTGLFGLVLFLFMILRYTKWITSFQGLGKKYGRYYAIHAICLLMMLLVTSIFEPRLGGRLTAIQPLFYLYLITLDNK